jgi:hypothetical protein
MVERIRWKQNGYGNEKKHPERPRKMDADTEAGFRGKGT